MANPPTAGNAKKIGRGGRKRRVAGWTLLLLGLLVAGVWVASGWWEMGWASGPWSLALGVGTLEFHYWPMINPPTWWTLPVSPHAPDFAWRPRMQVGAGGCNTWMFSYIHPANEVSFWVVLWPIPLLLWTPAALLLRSGYLARRRANTGQCAKCGYSLAGLAADAPCPECGKGAKATA